MYAASALALFGATACLLFVVQRHMIHKAHVDRMQSRDHASRTAAAWAAAWTASQRGDAARLATLLRPNDAYVPGMNRINMLRVLRIAVLNDHSQAVQVILLAAGTSFCGSAACIGIAARTNRDGRIIAALVGAGAALVRAGADVDHLWDGYQTALHTAARYDNCGGVAALLSQKANVNVQWMGCGTPLHFAAFHGSAAAAQLLLDHGASTCAHGVDIIRPLVGNPLEWALHGGHASTVRVIQLAMRMEEQQLRRRIVTSPLRVLFATQ